MDHRWTSPVVRNLRNNLHTFCSTFSTCATFFPLPISRLSSPATQGPNCVLEACFRPQRSLTPQTNTSKLNGKTNSIGVWRAAVCRWEHPMCRCFVQMALVTVCRGWWTSPCYITSICHRYLMFYAFIERFSSLSYTLIERQ